MEYKQNTHTEIKNTCLYGYKPIPWDLSVENKTVKSVRIPKKNAINHFLFEMYIFQNIEGAREKNPKWSEYLPNDIIWNLVHAIDKNTKNFTFSLIRVGARPTMMLIFYSLFTGFTVIMFTTPTT